MMPVPWPPTPMAAITIWSLGPSSVAFCSAASRSCCLRQDLAGIPERQSGELSEPPAIDREIPVATMIRVRLSSSISPSVFWPERNVRVIIAPSSDGETGWFWFLGHVEAARLYCDVSTRHDQPLRHARRSTESRLLENRS